MSRSCSLICEFSLQCRSSNQSRNLPFTSLRWSFPKPDDTLSRLATSVARDLSEYQNTHLAHYGEERGSNGYRHHCSLWASERDQLCRWVGESGVYVAFHAFLNDTVSSSSMACRGIRGIHGYTRETRLQNGRSTCLGRYLLQPVRKTKNMTKLSFGLKTYSRMSAHQLGLWHGVTTPRSWDFSAAVQTRIHSMTMLMTCSMLWIESEKMWYRTLQFTILLPWLKEVARSSANICDAFFRR